MTSTSATTTHCTNRNSPVVTLYLVSLKNCIVSLLPVDTMPQALPLPAEVAALPETMKKFREHAQLGNYALALRYHEQGRAAIDSFLASSEVIMEGDRSRRTKWRGLAAELDAEVKLVKVGCALVEMLWSLGEVPCSSQEGVNALDFPGVSRSCSGMRHVISSSNCVPSA